MIQRKLNFGNGPVASFKTHSMSELILCWHYCLKLGKGVSFTYLFIFIQCANMWLIIRDLLRLQPPTSHSLQRRPYLQPVLSRHHLHHHWCHQRRALFPKEKSKFEYQTKFKLKPSEWSHFFFLRWRTLFNKWKLVSNQKGLIYYGGWPKFRRNSVQTVLLYIL